MRINPKTAANWVREVALRQRNLTNLPLNEAAPVWAMRELIMLVEGRLVSRVIAKEMADEIFAKVRSGEISCA